MAREAFLINPPKKIGSARFKLHNNSKRRRSKKVLNNSWFETPTGTRKFSVKHSDAAIKGAKRHKSIVSQLTANPERRKHRANPLAEGLMLIGGNPPMKRHKRKHTKKKGFLSFLDNPRRSHKLRHSKRRRHKRNPAVAASSALSFKNPMSLAMPALIGVGGAVASVYIPNMLGYKKNADGTTPFMSYVVKLGVGAAGFVAFKGQNRVAWIAGVAAGVIAPIVEGMLGTSTTSTSTSAAGLGAFIPQSSFNIPMIAQTPSHVQYGAFPNELSEYPSEAITPY